MRYHLKLIRMNIYIHLYIYEQELTKGCQGSGENGTLVHHFENVNQCSHYGRKNGVSLKN